MDARSATHSGAPENDISPAARTWLVTATAPREKSKWPGITGNSAAMAISATTAWLPRMTLMFDIVGKAWELAGLTLKKMKTSTVRMTNA